MIKFKKQYVVLLIVVTILSFQLIRSAVLNYIETKARLEALSNTSTFHTDKELAVLDSLHERGGPIDPGELFLNSRNCRGCHGYDSAQYALVTNDSVDVSLYNDWVGTMMANSAKDPLWRAKVSHEILVNPSHSLEIQNTCTKCHAPMGNYMSMYQGNPFYTIANMLADPDTLGLDGVSCMACHMIGDQGLGTLFSGTIPYDTSHVLYGPFTGVQTGPMQLYIGMTPTWSDHMSQGKVCSSCHTLLTNSVDLGGTPTGRTFIEQATFHEWENSTYSGDQVVCQSCHMPPAEDSVRIATGYFGLPKRYPFNQHVFKGSNLFMLKLLKQNRTRLDLKGYDRNFDSTIAANIDMLENRTMNVNLSVDSVNTDTAYFTVRLTNKAGHKFPSGYPSRRAVLQFVVIGSANDTIFQSGMFDPTYEVVNIDPTWEPHYNIISNETQAQIYEMVPGDVNGNFTSLLERADTMLKDNRIPPEGFTTTSPVYDTVQIIGGAATDPDFNLSIINGTEGTGKDYVHFHVPINGYSQPFSIYTYMQYQAVPPGFLEEMFSMNSAEIDTFRNMYMAADQSPYCVGSDSIINIALGVQVPDYDDLIKVGPTPTQDGFVNIYLPGSSPEFKLTLYEANGRFVNTWLHNDLGTFYNIQLPTTKGTYILDMIFKGKHFVRKLIRN
jgi:hypothetical protein